MEEEAVARTGEDPKVDPNDVNGPDEDIGPNPLKGLPPFGASLFNERTKVEWVECAWPRLESYFTKNGFRCAFGPSEGVLGFWNPNATEGDEACVRAWYLITMIATNNLHPSLALEITNGHRGNRHILIGSQELGLCSIYGIDKEEFLKRRQRLIASEKTIYKLTCCSLYTSEDTVVVVGDDDVRLEAAEYLVNICIILGCHPVSVIKTIAVNEGDNCGFCSGNIDFECFFSELEKGEIEEDDIFQPGDGLHHGPSSFTYPITENTENKCKEDRQKVESYLKDLDITWTFDQDSMTVSTTNKFRKTCVKARLMLRLLARTDLSPSEAIDILNGSEQHAFIWIGNPKDSGLCSEFGISETEFNERVEWLKRSLQDIEQFTKSHAHVRGNTVTAAVASVGNSEGLEMVRIIVESCIVHGVDPAQFMLRIKHTETDTPVERSPGEGSLGGPVTSFTEFFDEDKEERVLDAWPMAKLCTFKGVISYSLDVAKHSMTASTTGKTKDIAKARRCLAKARRLLELLTTTDLPASLAVEIVAGLRKYVFIKIGTQEGGLCSKFGITEVEFIERRDRLMAHFKEIVNFAGCDLYIHENTATAVGTCVDPEDSLILAKRLVEAFIVHNVAPEWVKKVRERKFKAGGGSGGDQKKRKRESQAETSKEPRPLPEPKGDLSTL